MPRGRLPFISGLIMVRESTQLLQNIPGFSWHSVLSRSQKIPNKKYTLIFFLLICRIANASDGCKSLMAGELLLKRCKFVLMLPRGLQSTINRGLADWEWFSYLLVGKSNAFHHPTTGFVESERGMILNETFLSALTQGPSKALKKRCKTAKKLPNYPL